MIPQATQPPMYYAPADAAGATEQAARAYQPAQYAGPAIQAPYGNPTASGAYGSAAGANVVGAYPSGSGIMSEAAPSSCATPSDGFESGPSALAPAEPTGGPSAAAPVEPAGGFSGSLPAEADEQPPVPDETSN